MPVFIALLRGVNVGRGPRVPMAGFRGLLATLGYRDVATLLNSGNAVFHAARGAPPAHAKRISGGLSTRLGVDVPVVVKSVESLAGIVAECPSWGTAEPSRVLVAFTQDADDLAGLAAVGALVAPPERFMVGRHAAYLFCASGIHGSRAGQALLGRQGRAATTRNWATTLKLLAMADRGRPSAPRGG